MNTNIKATNITLTDSISEYVAKRFQTIEKFLENDPTVRVDIELARTTAHHKSGDIFKAEIHIVGQHRDIFVTVEKSDLYAAIDALRDDVHNRVAESKDRRISFVRKGGAKVKNIIRQFFGSTEE
jgi:putative sigma-54 modulation protein